MHLPPEQPEPRLKWPNDLMVGGGKLAGILLERAGDAVVVGIGVNVAHRPALADRPTASMHELGSAVAAGTLVETLAERFAFRLAEWRQAGLARILQLWMNIAHPLGSVLHVHDGEGQPIEGLFDGLSSEGALRLRLADGTTRIVHAGEVSLG